MPVIEAVWCLWSRLLWHDRSFINTNVSCSNSATIVQCSACHSISVFTFPCFIVENVFSHICTVFPTTFLLRYLSVCEIYLHWLIFRGSLQSSPVVFNLFHGSIHFATHFNLTTLFRKYPVRHMTCSCVCAIENHNDEKITYDITMVNKYSLFILMHMAASVRDPRNIQITP